jgi:peroxiredoxin (alkyl hydroperoxide reductase subunit C)
MAELACGSQAPAFRGTATGGREISLADYRGKCAVVLFFFPGAFCPACVRQAVDLERSIDTFKSAGAEVIGVSVDSPWVLDLFSATLGGLSFPLVSDLKHEIGAGYGVFLAEQGLNGRAVFLIDREGRVKWSKSYDLRETPDLDEVVSALKGT